MTVLPRLVRCYALVALTLVAVAVSAPRAFADDRAHDASSACRAWGACGLDELIEPHVESGADASAPVTLLFFWGVGCSHCEEARPFVEALAREFARLRVEAIEVRNNPVGRRRFIDTMDRLGARTAGVPTFVVGHAYVVGYTKGVTETELRALVEAALGHSSGEAEVSPTGDPPIRTVITIPWIGDIDPRGVSLPALTVAMGIADGVNPCAIWVLVVLLGILLHVKTRKRMLLYAGTFVAMSAIVYFLFMTAWATLFELAGLSGAITKILGAVLVAMGLINLKDVVWFKRGVSLVIPDRVKPGLYRRMRAIARTASTPAALGGIAALAFVVNLVELGCTLGLPAIYTRVLSLRGVSMAPRLAYLALYNMAYVVPLLAIVAAFIALERRLVVTPRVARALKAVSGLLLTAFGVLFLVAPDALSAM